jgi:uncharacterized protein (DUF4415 family)
MDKVRFEWNREKNFLNFRTHDVSFEEAKTVPKSNTERTKSLFREKNMKKEYDLRTMKGRKSPYANRLKKQITIRLDHNTIEYFKRLSKETGFSYQTLINLYLKECAENNKKLRVQWVEPNV